MENYCQTAIHQEEVDRFRVEDKKRIIATIARLQEGDSELHAIEAERLLMKVLGPLLAVDGYDVHQTPMVRDGGVDFLATRAASEDYQDETIGIEFKYYRSGRLVSVEHVRQLIGVAMLRQLEGGNQLFVTSQS